MIRGKRVVLGIVLSLMLKPVVCLAIFATGSMVHDPGVMSQAILTVKQTLDATQKQARMILQNVEMLANQAKNLAAGPIDMVKDIEKAMNEYTRLMNEGNRLNWQIKYMTQQFETLYASGFNGDGTMMQRATAMLSKVRQVGHMATQTQAIYDRITGQQATVNKLMLASKAAPGNLAIQRTNAELLGTLAEQQTSIQLLLAANGEMNKHWIMTQTVAAEQAMAHGQTQAINAASFPPLGAGLGKGPRLP